MLETYFRTKSIYLQSLYRLNCSILTLFASVSGTSYGFSLRFYNARLVTYFSGKGDKSLLTGLICYGSYAFTFLLLLNTGVNFRLDIDVF